MAWTMEQAYPIFLDVVLCVILTELFYFCLCVYVCLIACILIYNNGRSLNVVTINTLK